MPKRPETQPASEAESAARSVRRKRIAYFVCSAIAIVGFAFSAVYMFCEGSAAFASLPLEPPLAVSASSLIIFFIGREFLKEAQVPSLPKRQRWLLVAICLVIFCIALAIDFAIDNKGQSWFGFFAVLYIVQDVVETIVACRMGSSDSEQEQLPGV